MKSLPRAILMLAVLTVLTGLVYPLAITAIAAIVFPEQSGGSLAYVNGRIVGSHLIGQNFADSAYFWPRPSATNYSAMPSGGSNLNPISHALRTAIDARRDAFRSANGLSANDTVPNDMLFISGSGLDPDISPDAARLQIGRIARKRHLTNPQQAALSSLFERSIIPPQLGFLGSTHINVLQLNKDLNQLGGCNTMQE
jgi:K+-transporting ATPase ATPase C chain